MKAYRLFVHRNFGADSFDKELIDRIMKVLEEKGILYSALKPDFWLSFEGEPGEELDFDTCGFTAWPDDNNDMVEISREFPECSFCLRVVEDDLMDIQDYYYHNGASSVFSAGAPEPPATNIW